MRGRGDRYRSHWRRRRAGGLALLLVVVGVVAAPVLDGWLHAAEGAPAAAQDAGDCVVHKLAGTHLVGTAGAPTFAAPGGDGHRDAIPAPRTLRRARGDRLTPPSRAPPA